VRLLMGGHVTTGLVESLPVPVWTASADQRRIAALARQISAGSRPRAQSLRPEGSQNSTMAVLHAAVAKLYGLDASTFERLLEGFPLVPVEDRTSALETFSHFR